MSVKVVGSLNVVEGKMNGDKYRQVLVEHLLPSIPPLSTAYGEFIFQLDGAPWHMLRWLSGSPDLFRKSPSKTNPCATEVALIAKIEEIWAHDAFV